jgi:predicted glutamine amidotransferase
MCLIIEKPAGQEIKKWILESALEYNRDGFGIMHEGHARKWKSLGLSEICDALEPLIDIDVAVHFRMATDGRINKHNAHPFKLKNKSWLMHNGVLSAYRTGKDDARSDTRRFVEEFCNTLIKQHGSVPRAAMEGEILGSTICLMQKDGTINRYGSGWTNYEGCYFSNEYAWDCPTYTSKYYTPSRSIVSYAASFDDEDGDYSVGDFNVDLATDIILDLEMVSDMLPYNDPTYIDYADVDITEQLLSDQLSPSEYFELCSPKTLLSLYRYAAVNQYI